MAKIRPNWRDLQEKAVLDEIEKKKLPPKPRIRAHRKHHQAYLDALEEKTITIVTGPAGTGKTYMAAGVAAQLLMDGKIEKVILTRAVVQCRGDDDSEELGAFPGEVDDKFGPYCRPIREAFMDFMDKETVDSYMLSHKIEMIPMELMRGASLKKTMLICDEAQNANRRQLKMLLTRLDYDSKFVISGDIEQSDLRRESNSALAQVITEFRPDCHDEIGIVEMDEDDIMRPPLIKWILKRMKNVQ